MCFGQKTTSINEILFLVPKSIVALENYRIQLCDIND